MKNRPDKIFKGTQLNRQEQTKQLHEFQGVVEQKMKKYNDDMIVWVYEMSA